MKRLSVLILASVSVQLFADISVVSRLSFDKTKLAELRIIDDRPALLTLTDLNTGRALPTLILKYEGTYGSDEALPMEYFSISRPAARSSAGQGNMRVAISYVSVRDAVQIGGVTIHGTYGSCEDSLKSGADCKAEIESSRAFSKIFDGVDFTHSDGKPDTVYLPKFEGGTVPGRTVIPFCQPEPGLASLEGAQCRVHFSDVYQPIERWFVMFYAYNPVTNYQSGASFSRASWDKENPDGNGIYLDRAKKPVCVQTGACAFFTGYVRYWNGKKKSYFAVEIRLKNGLPTSATAHSLNTYGGGVGR